MIENRLAEFTRWLAGRQIESCRLVHYSGMDTPNAIDVSLNQVFGEIEGCLKEGFLVDWEQKGDRLFIAVQEPECPMPPWEKAFREEAVIDVEELLR